MSISKHLSIPNLFIVGAAKAGTTSLYEYLVQHPDIYMSPVKEPHYFSDVYRQNNKRLSRKPISDEKTYLSLFEAVTNERVIGEASTSYFGNENAPSRIYAFNPKAKIIVMLRDPVERAYSYYLQRVREGGETGGFYEAVREQADRQSKEWRPYLDAGFYSKKIEKYKNLFGDQIQLLIFEEFIREPIDSMARVFDFLEVDTSITEHLSYGKHNPYRIPRNALASKLIRGSLPRRIGHFVFPDRFRRFFRESLLRPTEKPAMSDEAREFLISLYEEEVDRVQTMFGRPLPWRNFQASGLSKS